MGRVCSWLSKAAAKSTHAMDKRITIMSELQPPGKRHGKRKKAEEPRYNEYVLGPMGTWSGIATFGLMIAFVLAFSIAVGATHCRILGSEAVGLSAFAFGATSLLNHADDWNVPPLGRPPRFSPVDEGPPITPETHTGLAAVLASMDSFNFNGRTAVAAYEWCSKDSKDGWIWGNSPLMTEE